VGSRMLPNAAKPPQKNSLKTEGRYQAGVPHLTSGEHDLPSLLNPKVATTLLNSRLQLVRLGLFAPEPPERGRRRNFKTSYRSFHNNTELTDRLTK
jgi:hypothetical protein